MPADHTDPHPRPTESTAELILRLRGGDQGAGDRLMQRYLPRLWRIAHGRVPRSIQSRIDTDDLVQITLARSFERLGHFEPREAGSFLVYLRTALRNRIRDEIRRESIERTLPDSEGFVPNEGLSPLEAAIGSETLAMYESALSRLQPIEAEAVIMRIEMEFTFPEIAEAMGDRTSNAARMRVTRALIRLAAIMKEDGAES